MGFADVLKSLIIRRSKFAMVGVSGILLLVPACGIPGLRVADAPPALPTGFSVGSAPADVPVPLASVVGGALAATTASQPIVSADSSAQLGVADFYSDPILARLIDEGVANNRELKIRNEEVQIARNEILARQGAFLPFLTYGAQTGFDRSSRYTRDGAVDEGLTIPPGGRILNPLPMSSYGLNFYWTPDFFRALRNARDAAMQRYYAASERRYYFVTRLVADIAENYYRLQSLDARIAVIDLTIDNMSNSLAVAELRLNFARGSALPVFRFQAEVKRNQALKLVVNQDVIVAENRINVLLNRFPGPVERSPVNFTEVQIHALDVGLPGQLLANRADIRAAEREIIASGLDVRVARTRFYPAFAISAGIGYQAFNPRYLFDVNALVANAAGSLVAPLVNKKAIQADYMSANARQLQALYDYQRIVINAFTEVVNNVTTVQNYQRSIELKRMQLASLVASVDTATSLFQGARIEYIEVLIAQRDLLEARTTLIETKREQLLAVVNAYQALGGGGFWVTPVPAPTPPPSGVPGQPPINVLLP
jgi:multidrug efflux system outer membrane protein